jgi:hypothetical protein
MDLDSIYRRFEFEMTPSININLIQCPLTFLFQEIVV